MKLYRVNANSCGYDQYDCFLIWAHTIEQAREIAIKESVERTRVNNFRNADVLEVTKPSEPEILQGSFIAG